MKAEEDMVKIQLLARILYKAFVLTMLILLVNPNAYWGIWAGLLIGYLTESVSLTNETQVVSKDEMQIISVSKEMLDALESIENDDNSIPDVIWQMRNNAILKAKNILKNELR